MMRAKLNYQRLTVAVIVLAGLLRFLLAAFSRVSGDACWHLAVSRFSALNMQLPLLEPFGGGNRGVFWAPPLFHVVSAAVYKAFAFFSPSVAEVAVRLVSPLFGTLTLIVVFLIARRLFDEKIAFFSTLFMALLPVHVYYSALSFVDVFVTFFVALAVLLLLQKRTLLAGLVYGLALLSKSTAVFAAPVMLFLLVYVYGRRVAIKRAVPFVALSTLVGSLWFIRNMVVLGNPVWPFLYTILGGRVAPTAEEAVFSVSSVFNPAHVIQLYLSFFGVPLGNAQLLVSPSLPLQPFSLAGWLLATLLFLVPLAVGMFHLGVRGKRVQLLWLWLAAHLAGLALYVMNLDTAYSRLIMPMFPALAMFWAVGVARSTDWHRRAGLVVLFVMVAVSSVFVAAEAGKVVIADRLWQPYDADFRWVQENAPEDTLFYYRGQCLSYHTRRLSGVVTDPDYVWLNPAFAVEPIASRNETLLSAFPGSQRVYQNNASGTAIYRVVRGS